jgi:ABC-2 type transport system permease protein
MFFRELSYLIAAKIRSYRNAQSQGEERGLLRRLLFISLGLGFWLFIFVAFFRVLDYFRSIEGVGDVLALKLLSMVFLVFFSILLFSNIITALTTFFMSRDLELLITIPLLRESLYAGRFVETMVNSSWMVVLFGMPVFLAYGVVFAPPLSYYGIVALVMIPFLVVCAGLASIIVFLLVFAFPARRIKDVVLLLGVFLFIVLYFVFRMIRPEQFVDPDKFEIMIDYLAAIRAPTFPLLPSQWVTDTVSPFLFGYGKDPLFFTVLMFSTALAIVVIGNWTYKALYYDAWSKAQEARRVRLSLAKPVDVLLNALVRPFSLPTREIIKKDIRTFFRDATQWSQLFLLMALIAIYLYNFSILPIDKSPLPTLFFQNLVSFLNLGLAGFVIAAVAVRFSFPAISLEGESFWIIRSSPVGLKGLLWSKFWISYLFLFVLAETLILCSDYLLRASGFMVILSAVTIALMTLGITSLAVGLGACFPRFRVENVAHIPTGFGGTLFMIVSVIFVGVVVALEAGPVHIFLWSRLKGMPLTSWEWVRVGVSLTLALAVNVVAFLFPVRIGLKKLAAMEF